MDKKLTITQEQQGESLILHIAGRLDGNWAGYLDDTLIKLIQEGHYHVSLDLKEVVFLSSAGIRILVKQHKAFRGVSGELCMVALSGNVKSVLDMVGMTAMFQPSEKVSTVSPKSNKNDVNAHGYCFKKQGLPPTPHASLQFRGDPDKLIDTSFSRADNELLRFDKPFFGLGIGAFGEGFDDCKSRYGEFIALGEGVANLPADKNNTPDYMIKAGNLVPEINTLYHIGIEGAFQQAFMFTPQSESSIGLRALIETITEMGQHQNFGFLLIAESRGLIGATLKATPISGQSPFAFPQVRELINFTTEPAHIRALVVAFGVIVASPSPALKPFLRPMGKDQCGHVHAAVFPYMPLRKEKIDYSETINSLLNNSEIIDVMHLLNDTREITGLGESTFKSGHCWTTEITL